MKENRVGVAIGKSKSIKRFWPMLGPYIASREVTNELNDKIYDDEQTVWFILFVKGGRNVPDDESVIGFCCARITESKCELRHDYIREEYRDKKRYSLLFKIRQSYLSREYPDKPQEIVTQNELIIEKLNSESFKVVAKRGSYSVFRREDRK